MRLCTDNDYLKRTFDCLARPLEGRMGDIEWKPLPTGLWTPPAVFAEVGNLLLQAFTDDGVPTWEISKKTGERAEWNVIEHRRAVDRRRAAGARRDLDRGRDARARGAERQATARRDPSFVRLARS